MMRCISNKEGGGHLSPIPLSQLVNIFQLEGTCRPSLQVFYPLQI